MSFREYALILLLTMLRTLPLGESARLLREAKPMPEGGRSNTLLASDTGDASCGVWMTRGERVSRVSREKTPRFSGHWK